MPANGSCGNATPGGFLRICSRTLACLTSAWNAVLDDYNDYELFPRGAQIPWKQSLSRFESWTMTGKLSCSMRLDPG